MSVELPNGKVALTLPEQVGKNAKNIEKIFQLIDGLNIQDNVVVVDDIAHVMTSQELNVVKQAVSFIVYNGQLYIKESESAGSAYFDIVFSITSGTAITFNSKQIEVNLSNGALSITTSTTSTYSTTQIDTKLGAKANITYVDSNFASLAGANFTGGITAPSIIQTMAGYSFVKKTPAASQGTLSYVYASAVQTGNKLTLVCAFTFTKAVGASGYLETGEFRCPPEVMNKIYPAFETYIVDVKKTQAYKVAYTGLDIISQLAKYGGSSVVFSLADISSLNAGDSYYIRQEVTILLSDNLAA